MYNNGTTYLFCGNDGGVSRFTWENKVMESINGPGLNNLQFYGIANNDVTPKYYIGGTQDNGMIGNGLGYWHRYNVGDGYEAIVDAVAPNIVYCTSNGGTRDVNKSTNYGQTFSSSYTGISYPTRKNYGLNDRPFCISSNDHNTLYICYDEVYKTTNGANNWNVISNFQTKYGSLVTGSISGLGISASDENTIYVGFDQPLWGEQDDKRLFKTINGGSNWTDLTASIYNIVHWLGITNILVSPDDANKIWISFGGFAVDDNGNSINRIIYSSDGGTNWTDISYNLPNLPVNCLAGIYFDNAYTILLGNDLGIFLFNEQNEEWEDISNGLPPCIVSDIEVNYSDRELSIASFGRGIWKSNIPCIHLNNDIIITQNESWETDRILFSDVIIESGGILELKSKVFANDSVTIFVKRGGELILNGGLLTSNCGMWQGIQVWGTATASQSTPGAQGKLTIINGGTIENAVAAVRTAKTDGIKYEYGYEGGIIQTNDAHIINNRIGVRFYPYRNMVSGVEMDNLSYFQNSEFLTDAELADESAPEKCIYLDAVKGINIQGCTFTNSRPEEEAAMSDRGIGIYSYDADFTVSWYCESGYPCEDPDSSKFINLNYGIKAYDATTTRNFKVNHSGFYNNLTGIYLNNIDYADIIFNDFELYNVSLFHDPDDIFGGVYFDGCSLYTIEENNFFNDDENDPQNEIRSIGITVNSSGNDLNMIYRNTFNRLHLGILAQNGNRGSSFSTGLKLKCNSCTNNEGDFAVTAETSSVSMGISIYQGAYIPGDITAPAGNLFSHANNSDPYSDFNNTLSRQWIYYFRHNGTSQDPWVPVYYQNITQYGYIDHYDFDIVCPTNFSLGGGLKNSELILMNEQELKSRMISMENLRDSAANELSLWIDAGNTSELNYEVQSSTPNESLDIYDELITDSPYLSDTVLASSIEKEDVLVNAMIRDIMVANPHGAKKEDLIEALEQRVPPVPEYMMVEIIAGLDSIAQKEQRESEIAWYAQERELAYNKLLKLYLDDESLISAKDSLASLIVYHGILNSQYFLANRYLEYGDASAAFTLLNALPNQYPMDSEQQSEHQDYLTLFTMINNINQQGLPLDSLNNASRQILYQIAANDSKPAIMAQNILQYIDTVSYPEVYILPISGPITRKYQAENPGLISGFEQGNNFRVFPNPCHNYFILEYYFKIIPRNASYSIIDPLGRIIDEGPVDGQQNQLIRRTNSYSSGLYTIKLIINGKVDKALKLNVIK